MSKLRKDLIISCPFREITIPNISAHDYIIQNFFKHYDKVALEDKGSGKVITYHDLYIEIKKVTCWLWKQGMRKGDFLVMYSLNNIEYMVVSLAAMMLGGIVSLANPMHTKNELIHHIEDCSGKFLFVSSELLQVAVQATPKITSLKTKILSGGIKPGFVTYSDILKSDSMSGLNFEDLQANVDPNKDTAVVLYSSGTTGLPKGVELTHRAFVSMIINASHPKFEISKDCNVVVLTLPFSHIAGFGTALYSLSEGFRGVVFTRFDFEQFIRALAKYQVKSVFIVPPIAVLLAKSPVVDKYDLSCLQSIFIGAAPLSKETENEVKKRLPAVKFRQAYGMSETCGLFTTLPHGKEKAGSSGIPVINCAFRIVDVDTGEILGPQKRGEVHVQGDQIMKRYLNNPKATKETFTADGWLKTGDIAYYDDEGFIFIVDRLKELIKYNAYQVAPAELEGMLLQHPKVADAAVIGIPDEMAGELPKAFVVPKEGQNVTELEIKRFIAENLAHYKQLRGGVTFVKEIPKSPSGKILRKYLRNPKSKL